MKQLFTLLTILLLIGCVPQQSPADIISEDSAADVPAADIISEDSALTDDISAEEPVEITPEESDGDLGIDAPDKFSDGQIELKPGEYTRNALLRNDDFDDRSDDIDFYKFTVNGGEWFKLTITPVEALDVFLNLHDEGGKDKTWDYTYYTVGSPDGKAVFKLNSGIAGKEESFFSQMSSDESSYTFYFSVQAVSGKGAYTIQLETKQQNDASSSRDAGSKPASSVSLEAGKEYSALLNYNDIIDCYKLTAGAEATIIVTPTEKLNPSFTIHDEGGKDKTWDLTYYKKTNKQGSMFKINDADTGLQETVTWKTTSSTQYICVKKESGSGDYTVSYS